MSAIDTSQITQLTKYATVVSSGQSALQALLTLNGGATIAFLTFIGHLWDKGKVPPPESTRILISALRLFIYGAFFAVLAYGTIFLTNCLSSVHWDQASNVMFGITVTCGFLSLGCFLFASRRAVSGFNAISSLMRE
jgi:hypothetical protein